VRAEFFRTVNDRGGKTGRAILPGVAVDGRFMESFFDARETVGSVGYSVGGAVRNGLSGGRAGGGGPGGASPSRAHRGDGSRGKSGAGQEGRARAEFSPRWNRPPGGVFPRGPAGKKKRGGLVGTTKAAVVKEPGAVLGHAGFAKPSAAKGPWGDRPPTSGGAIFWGPVKR